MEQNYRYEIFLSPFFKNLWNAFHQIFISSSTTITIFTIVRIFPTFFPHNASFSPIRESFDYLRSTNSMLERKLLVCFVGEKPKSGKVRSERFDYRSVTFRWLIGENEIGQLEAANVAKEAIGHTCGTITPAFACEPKNVTLLSQQSHSSNFHAELPPWNT